MGTYIAQSDVESRWGTNNVLQWSNLDNSTTSADTTRIAAAITFAEAYVQDRLRGGPYTIPFSANSSGAMETLEHQMATLAGCWLYSSRGTNDTDTDAKLDAARNDVDLFIARVASGQIRLDLAASYSMPNAPVVV